MSNPSRRHSPRRQVSRLLRRHRPMMLTIFAAAVAVLAAVLVFTHLPGG